MRARRGCAASSRGAHHSCAHPFSLPQNAPQCDQHFKGLYAPYVRVWTRAFAPRWQSVLLFLRTEAYTSRPRDALERVFAFVGLRAPSDEAWWATTLRAARSTNGAPRNWSAIPPMSSATRAAVDAFYAPHNAPLAAMLGDPSFRWAA